MSVLDVRPGESEVAVAWLPAGVRVSLFGRDIPQPDADESARYVTIGWDKIAGGALTCTYYGWQGIRNGKRGEERPVWDEAARLLRTAAKAALGPAAVYVKVERSLPYGHGTPVWLATAVREA